MAHVFDVIKRTFDDNAIVLFIDLLGTRTYWKSATPTEDQALTTIQALLGDLILYSPSTLIRRKGKIVLMLVSTPTQ